MVAATLFGNVTYQNKMAHYDLNNIPNAFKLIEMLLLLMGQSSDEKVTFQITNVCIYYFYLI